MKSTKPMIVELGSATEAIQFVVGAKDPQSVPDMDPNNPIFSTGGSYNIDE